MTKDILVIYHANCADGFAAAMAAYLAVGDWADYLPMFYNEAPPDVTGKRVFIVDFSFKPDVLRAMSQQARSVVLVDHHKAMCDELAGLTLPNLSMRLDPSKCGARLAWEYFLPQAPVPALIDYVEDRDLWLWKVPQSEAYLAALDAEERSFARWLELAAMAPETESAFIERGRAILAETRAILEGFATKAVTVTLRGAKGLMVNAPQDLRNELGERLAKSSGTFGMVWSQEPSGSVKVSLRSVAPFEVLPLAQHFGGGGHARAASFYLPLDQVPALITGRLG